MLTIEQWINTILVISFGLVILLFWIGLNRIRKARLLPYFVLRRKEMAAGWRVILIAVIVGFVALLFLGYGEAMVFLIVQPTPSITPTPSPTATPSHSPTPTITLTPSISPTATITRTPTQTPTPMIPEAITVLFKETITPEANAVFSRIDVSRRLDNLNRPINPDQEFQNPINTLYGAFTYDFLTDGARWTAIWYRGEEVVCVESKPWDGGTGGYGFTECNPRSLWLSGEYEIRMFLGEQWKVSARFTISGNPATPTLSPSADP